MNLRKLFSLVLSVSVVSGAVPAWTTVHADPLPVETALATAPALSGAELVMSETDDGSEISIYGSDNKQVISLDGTVYTPLVDQTVNLILKAENGESVTKGTTNVSVTVPGLYETFESDNEKPATLPAIQEWKGGTGDFVMSQESKIIYNDASLAGKAEQIKTFFKNMLGYTVSVEQGTEGASGDVVLVLDTAKTLELGDEGYYAEITDKIVITAPTELAILYGGTTITQIMSQSDDKNTAPQGIIRDYPAYEVRSIMMDIARPYYPLEFIESIGMYMSYYKLNEFHAHLNEGAFRVESEVYDFLNNEKSYSKADYIAMETRLSEYGVSVLNEIDTPGHSGAFSGNDWDIPMKDSSHLDVTTDENREKAEIGIQRLYDEFISGEWTDKNGDVQTSEHGPIVLNDEMHIGLDEYLHTSGQDAAIWSGYKQYTIDMLNYVTGKGIKAREWIFLGDSTNADEFPAYTEAELAQIENPEMVTANIWIEQWGDAQLALDYGFNIVNSENWWLYFVPGVKGYWQNYPLANRFDNWEVTTYYSSNENILKGHPQNRGASACLWFDTAGQNMGYSYEDIFAQVKDMVMLISEKTWHGDKDSDQTGEEFEQRVDMLGEYAPMANPGARVASDTKKVAEYTFDTDGADSSANGYDAILSGISVTDGALTFDGTAGAYMSIPFEKIGFPYTVSFDLTLSEYPASGETMNLFANDDGSERMYIDSVGQIFYEGTGPCQDNAEEYQFFGYTIPLGQKVNLTLACEEAENITTSNAKTPMRYDLSLIVNDSEEYVAQHTTSSNYYSTRQAIQTAKIGEGLKGTMDNLLFYNVNALQESLSEEDALSQYAVNMVEDAYEMEDTSVFAAAGVNGYGGGSIDNTVYHSGAGSLKVSGKKNQQTVFSIKKEIRENTSYVLSFWMKVENSDTETLDSLYGFVQSRSTVDTTKMIINQNTSVNIKKIGDWQYVTIPINVKTFNKDGTGQTTDTVAANIIMTPNASTKADGTRAAASAVPYIWIDQLSFRELPSAEYTISCTESTNTINDSGKLVITNIYDSKYITSDGAKLIIDGTETEDITVKATQSLTSDKTTAVIEYNGSLATGTHTIEVVMLDVWGKEVTNTISDLSFTNYSDNLFSHITTCDETADFAATEVDGSMASSGVSFDSEEYHSATQSIKVTDKANFKEIMRVSAGKVDLGKKYVCTLWLKPDGNESTDYRNRNQASGLNMYIRYNNTGSWTSFGGVPFGESGDHWRKVSFVVDNATYKESLSALADLEEAELSFMFTPYGAKTSSGQTLWIDDVSLYLLPEDGVMTPECTETAYSQTADGGLDVTYTFDSANISNAGEYITVDDTKTAAEITHEEVDGKTVVTAHIAKDSISFGSHTVALAGLTDIWARSIEAPSAKVYVLDHSVNLLEHMYECDDISSILDYGEATYTITNEASYSGDTSLKVEGASGYESLNKPREYAVKNNTNYIYSFMIKTDGEADRLYVFRDYWSTSGTTSNHTQFNSVVYLEKTTDWQRVTVEYCDDVPALKGELKSSRIIATPIGGAPERTYYLDCISLRSMPGENEMLSTLEGVSYSYGGAEFVFDTEYVNARSVTVDGEKTAAKLNTVYEDGKTYITAVFETPIAAGTHTVALSDAEDLWQRNVAAEGSILANNLLAYVTDAAKTVADKQITVTGKLNSNVPSTSAVYIVSVYNGEELVDTVIKKVTLSADASCDINETLDIGELDASGLSVRIMCWNSVDEIIPYMNAYPVE